MPRKTDKRARLIEAAKVLIHHQGFNLTTLADIAQEADVPLGNVYYYFKTKEAIGAAVIEVLAKEGLERLAAWDKIAYPRERLVALVEYEAGQVEKVARSGCPTGGLCQELAKQGGVLADAASQLLGQLIDWSEKQFKALAGADKAREHAIQLIATLQGTALLVNTFKDMKLFSKQSNSLIEWIGKMDPSAAGKSRRVETEDAVA